MSLTDNLISFWELEEASGNRNDSHGANHLTDNNTVTQSAGKVGNAAHFAAASSEYLNRADNASLSVGDIDFSLCAWVYLDSKPGFKGDIVGKHDSDDLEYDIRWHNGTDRFEFRIAGGTGPVNGQSITANSFGAPSTVTWYFIVAWHDSVANTINIQVNDGTVDNVAFTFGSYDSAAPFRIGALTDFSEYFDGRIDQVGFWKRILTAAERTELYNSGAGRSYAYISGPAPPGTLGQWDPSLRLPTWF